MITPEEARLISECHPNEIVQRTIRMTEARIEEQANRGFRKAMVGYTDDDYAREAAEEFKRRGFSIEVIAETLNGTRQYPAFFVCW